MRGYFPGCPDNFYKRKKILMKANEKQALLQIDKEEIKKIIAEVKSIVSAIIHLPAEKKLARAVTSLNVR